MTGDLDITTPMIISATGAVTVTGGASWADRIFHVVSGTVTIKGVTIRGGSVSGDGGGAVRIESGQSLTLNDSLLANSQAISRTTGGGIYNLGALALNNVTLSSNTANNVGGGIYNGGIATLTNVTLSGNSASCTSLSFNNFCSGSGGGIANNGTLTLTNVTFSDNSAVCNPFGWTCSGSGGGIVNGGGGVAATLTNVTFSGNSALCFGSGCVGGGGGIANSATLTLTNVTLSGNSASNGGGIYKSGGSMTFINTIVANSLSGSNCNTPIGGNSNLSSDGTCNFGAGRDNINVMLGPLANNGGPTLTHMLLPGSPAIDFGTNTGCPAADQRGASRPIGTTCDVGAVEASYLFLPLILK